MPKGPVNKEQRKECIAVQYTAIDKIRERRSLTEYKVARVVAYSKGVIVDGWAVPFKVNSQTEPRDRVRFFSVQLCKRWSLVEPLDSVVLLTKGLGDREPKPV